MSTKVYTIEASVMKQPTLGFAPCLSRAKPTAASGPKPVTWGAPETLPPARPRMSTFSLCAPLEFRLANDERAETMPVGKPSMPAITLKEDIPLPPGVCG